MMAVAHLGKGAESKPTPGPSVDARPLVREPNRHQSKVTLTMECLVVGRGIDPRTSRFSGARSTN
jgi:hypothetical protein